MSTVETKSRARDGVRQAIVAAGAAIAILGAAWGSGAFGGTPIEDAAGGALAPDATLIAAARPAFQIWSVIYAGLALFAVVQALASRAASPRYRATAWWILSSMLLNAAWIAVVQAGWLAASAVVLGAIVAVLVVTAFVLARAERAGALDLAATDVTVGLYLGWASVATAANVAASFGGVPRPVAIALVLIVLAGVLALVVRLRSGPLGTAIAAAAAWGLAWIGIARLDAPRDEAIAAIAFGAALIAAVAAVVRLARPSARR